VGPLRLLHLELSPDLHLLIFWLYQARSDKSTIEATQSAMHLDPHTSSASIGVGAFVDTGSPNPTTQQPWSLLLLPPFRLPNRALPPIFSYCLAIPSVNSLFFLWPCGPSLVSGLAPGSLQNVVVDAVEAYSKTDMFSAKDTPFSCFHQSL
jgi:hypothetical protein